MDLTEKNMTRPAIVPTRLALCGALFLLTGCTKPDPVQSRSTSPNLIPLESPAGAPSAEPNLALAPDGSVYMTWIERPVPDTAALRMARFDGAAWSEPTTIASGAGWFVNWADFPMLAIADDGSMAAHYLAKSGEATYAYDVFLTVSGDAGRTWSTPFTPHRDGTQSEHGFVSLMPWSAGRFFAAWLDGRNTAAAGHGEHGGAMSLRAAFFDAGGRLYDEVLLDDKTCDCCQTSAIRLGDRIIVAYRDRSDDEIRDIAVVQYEDGAWSEPTPVHHDGWEIAGCPVNGPVLAGTDNGLAVAWFTAAGGTPHVYVATSTDAGNSFTAPLRVDDGRPLGRVDLAFLGAGRLLVTWLETTDAGGAIRARLIASPEDADPVAGEAFTVAETSTSRQSGFPRFAPIAGGALFAWTDVQDEHHTVVRTALVRIE